MRHFLLDASALVDFVLNLKDPKVQKVRHEVAKLLALAERRKAVLHIPNICMAECSKAIARKVYESGADEAADDAYRRYVECLLNLVSARRHGLIHSLELRREHLEDIEGVFALEYRTAVRHRSARLSGVDAVVMQMGRGLARQHGDGRVVIVTAERWMAEVCGKNRPALPPAVYAAERPVPDA